MTPKLVRATKPALTGQHPDLWGDCSGLRGDCSGLRGDCSIPSTLYLHNGKLFWSCAQ